MTDDCVQTPSRTISYQAQMSGGIGLHELIPMAGDKPEDRESCLWSFCLYRMCESFVSVHTLNLTPRGSLRSDALPSQMPEAGTSS